jgi:hypothetical protein
VAHGLNPVGALLCGHLLETTGSGWTIAVFALCALALAGAAAADRVVREAPRQPQHPGSAR